jgi:predicted patatin/cPLA2 family phospholipase
MRSAHQASRVALVVEGGAMRGIFAAGVLDAFHEASFRPFDLAIGTSIGASNILSYLARQHGRARRCFLDQMSRPEFIDWRRGLRGGHFMDLDWVWDAITREDPLDCAAAAKSGVDYALVATCVASGEAVYLEPGADEMLDALKASCALPLLYRSEVPHDGRRLVDGGISDPIAVREAYRRGARTIVVIRSRTASYVRKRGLEIALSQLFLRNKPGLVRAYERSLEVYREAVAFIESPPEDCAILHVAPARGLLTGRTSRDRQALENDYALGRMLGRRAMARFDALAKGRAQAAA